MKRVTIVQERTGQYLLTVKNKAAFRAIAADMQRNGCEIDNPALDGTIAISEYDARELIDRRFTEFLRNGGEITTTIDDWTLRHIFGYCDK